MSWFSETLHRASWRGVPFGMELGVATLGRRKVLHEYPYRDTVWPEDQGKRPRSFRISGFLVGDSAIYGGGDVQHQRRRMERAAEAEGSGVLVHPSRGRLTVDLLDLVISERWDEGNYFELQFTFIESGPQVFPKVLSNLSALVDKVSDLADVAGLGAFVDKVTGPLQQGLDAAGALHGMAGAFVDRANALARDATSLYGTVSQLGGADFGRYFNGRNAGFLSGLTSIYAGAGSVAELIGLGAAQRVAVADAADAVTASIDSLGVAGGLEDVGGAIQAHVRALQATAADPADGIRLMTDLASYAPTVMAGTSATAVATRTLFQRTAAVAAARVSATYAPASADDANAVRAKVLAPLETAIAAAGASGEDSVFQALRGVRKAVVDDLAQRGGALARLTTIETPLAVPAVVLAQRQYGDANRGAELVTQADPIHPWFMPTAVAALAN